MTRRGDGAAGRGGLLRAWCSPRSYGLVVVLIVVTYTLALVTDRFRTAAPLLLAQAGTVWLALWRSRARRRLRRWATVVVGLAVLGAAVDTLAGGRSRVAALAFAVATVLYLVAPLSIVGHIAVRRGVDRETALGALAAYLLLGMAFAFGYRCLAGLGHTPFFGAAGTGTLAQDLFFSFVTLTTTGYGNLVPAGTAGQTVAVLEALLGQLFLVTAVSKIVEVWRPRGWRRGDHDDSAGDGADDGR